MKRIVSIQDISAVGKCSLTVALPIISAMGIECAILPTAVLSTHTMFSDFTFCDLTDQIAPISAHWKREGLGFDAIYTGYLGSFEQIELVSKFFDDFAPSTIIVDPAMADNGKLYPGFTPEFAHKMAGLCAKADLILPNLTEACFMLDAEYRTEYDRAYIEDMLRRLAALGAKNVLLTGVSFEKGKIGAAVYNSAADSFYYYFGEHLPVSFHGTGDIFSSAVVGALLNGMDANASAALAVDYTAECIRLTLKEEGHNWYGVNFEQAIPYLISLIK